MSDSKILLTFKNDAGEYQIESIWATKEGEYYRINNIPFLAPNIALDDLVGAVEENGALYYDKLIEPSGHSTVQMVILNGGDATHIGKDLEDLGCTWEGAHIESLISIDIPKRVPYHPVKIYLDKGEKANKWSYKEACLSHKY